MKELSLNILDIAQNSITAGAKNIGIELIEDSRENTLKITIADDGCGMDQATLNRALDPFYTSRKTRRVGLGLPLYKMAAELTGGSFNLDSEPGKGTESTAVFNTASVDFYPLGDIVSTVCILISGSPEIDFLFTHRVNEAEISLDTRELREVLGVEIPLSEPEVVEWIRASLTEQYAEAQNRET